MGFVTQFFIKPTKPALVELPHGSFMIDREGKLMTSTLPRSFPAAHIRAITDRVLAAFKAADECELKFVEVAIDFAALRLVARSMRGGALIFVEPQAAVAPP